MRSWSRIGLVAAAIAVGVTIATVDASPGWDDTGITAAALFVGAFAFAALDGRWPWLWALLVGAWLPLAEVVRGGDPAVVLAFLFSAAGASLGWALRRVLGTGEGDAAP